MAENKKKLLELLQRLFLKDDLAPLQAVVLYSSKIGQPNFEMVTLEHIELALFDPTIEEMDPNFIPNLIGQINRQHFGES